MSVSAMLLAVCECVVVEREEEQFGGEVEADAVDSCVRGGGD
jgi:hypothetical protein